MTTLTEFAERARDAAKTAILIHNYGDGPRPGDLKPGEKQCKFCKAKASCPALLAHVQDAVGADFDDLDADVIKTSPMGMGENSLGVALAAVPLIEDWCKAVRAKAESELLAGRKVAGFKLVQGRSGHRKWSDEAAVEKQLRKLVGAKGAFDMSLISPAQAEKKLKANKIGWEKLKALISQKAGPPSVAPETDSRPAWSPADDFQNLETEN